MARASSDTSFVSLDQQRAARPLVLTEDLRIDAARDDLAPIGWVVVRPDSVVAITQGADHQVRLYDRRGKLLSRVGGKGEGPQEFQGNIGPLGVVGDSVWVEVRSSGGSIVRVIAPDGTLGGKRRHWLTMPSIADVGRYPFSLDGNVLALLPDGSKLMMTFGGVFGPRDFAKGGEPILRVSPRGIIQRVVARIPAPLRNYVTVGRRDDLGGCAVAVPYAHADQWEVSADGNFISVLTTVMTSGPSGIAQITLLRGTGDTLFAHSYEFQGTSIPREDVDSAVNETVRELREDRRCGLAPVGAARTFEREARALIPPVYEPIVQVVIGGDGTTWLAQRRTGSVRPHLVLDERGIPVGRFVLPVSETIVAAERGAVWTMHTDENELESIIRYSVRGW